MTLEEAKAILAALVREHVEFVVIGSMAMAAQGLPRATHDLDLFVSPKIENLEALKRALRGLFNDPNVDQIDPGELAGDYPAVEIATRSSWETCSSKSPIQRCFTS
ncbi:MAG TPA: nucleotidyl transferase AbiEii/AbiGii toxin family protein [Thermoanaerobaculia bacterium]|nr:nucleotidyl transferase AbiEii/AbiGii toxin family protein [Thermoanaerobaculia bacterium]